MGISSADEFSAMRLQKFIFGLLLAFMSATVLGQPAWERKLQKELPLLGHRNWIVVADSAYPQQTAPGIETVYADEDQVKVVTKVLQVLGKTRHVKPIIYTDAELKQVPEKNAQGINAYREHLTEALGDRPVQVLPHEQIIAKLDEAGKTFKVLVIKTPLTLPYTSVFFQLDCGYWNAESEAELRSAIKAAGGR
jgi:D-ribose pyranose/furanose isomerase RbsD